MRTTPESTSPMPLPPPGQAARRPPEVPPQRANPWKWLVLGCGGLLLASCSVVAITLGLLAVIPRQKPVISGGGSPSTGQTGGLAGLGQTSTKGNWAITLDKVERSQHVEGWTSPPQGQYLIVYLTLKNVGKESYPLNGQDFSVRTQNGKKYHNVAAGFGQVLDGYPVFLLTQTVQPDLSTRTAVVFDVPPDARDLMLDVQGNRFRLPNP